MNCVCLDLSVSCHMLCVTFCNACICFTTHHLSERKLFGMKERTNQLFSAPKHEKPNKLTDLYVKFNQDNE